MKDGFTSFRICRSREEWLQALSVPPDWEHASVIPLPPELDESTLERLNAVARGLADRGARACPVDAVIAVGTRGRTAAAFFAWLTESPILNAEPGDLALNSIERLCGNKSNVLISCDKDFDAFGLTEISSTLGKLKVNFGFIYAYDMESALIAAFKAAFEPNSSKRANYLINAMSRLDIDKTFGALHVAGGTGLTADRMHELLVYPAHIKTIVAHGNGFDYNLGKAVLCCISGTIPVLNDPMLFSCFQNGECVKSAQHRVGVDLIQSDVLLMATCWGVFDGAVGLDYARTAYARLITGSGVWSLIATATAWTAAPQDWLRIQHALSESRTQGEATRRLNQILDPLHATFLLFGNPLANLQTTPNNRVCFEMDGPDDIHELTSGFQLLRIKPGPQSPYAIYVVKGEQGSASGHAEFAKAEDVADGTLLAFSENTLTLESAPVHRMGPRPGMETYARLCRNVAMVERLLPAFEGFQDKSRLAQRIATLKHQSSTLGRWLENRETGNGYALFEEEYGGIAALHEEWLSAAQSVISEWLAWSTEGPAARFVVDVWRQEFRRVLVAEGPRCEVCRKPTRNQIYVPLIEPLPERTLTLCRICSTKSDLPSTFELSINVPKIIDEGNRYRVSASLENGSHHSTLLGSAMYLMTANRVWPECVWQRKAVWMKEQETLELDCAIPKPEARTPAAHWFVILGLFDGAPFTHCTKVHISGDTKPGTSLLATSALS
jgi:hypothetical protein